VQVRKPLKIGSLVFGGVKSALNTDFTENTDENGFLKVFREIGRL